MTYGDGRFVAVSQGTSRLHAWTMTSTDGINWTEWAAPSPTHQTWSSVTYGDGLFVAVSGTGDGDRVMTSTASPGHVSPPPERPGRGARFTYGDGLFVAVLGRGNCSKYWRPVMTSPDGITWTLRDGAKRRPSLDRSSLRQRRFNLAHELRQRLGRYRPGDVVHRWAHVVFGVRAVDHVRGACFAVVNDWFVGFVCFGVEFAGGFVRFFDYVGVHGERIDGEFCCGGHVQYHRVSGGR